MSYLRNALLALTLAAPIVSPQTMKAPDITKEPTLYVVPYAHLDTQWRWEFPQTISEYLLKTMRVNFDYDRCVACELCVKVCPVKAMHVYFT